jgi:hypothetical protein
MGELSYKFLHNLHHGQSNDEESYIQQMSKFAIEGGLWRDFIAICWVSKYL